MELNTARLSQSFLRISTLVVIFFFISAHIIGAAGPATLKVSPASDAYQVGTPFSVDINVDGGGSDFIVAEAQVAVSSNLEIQGITFGNCYFAFIRTPTTSNPSFTGGIPGGSSPGCTVYTMELKPLAPGNATITISNGAVKSSRDASEWLGSYQNGNYALSGSSSNIVTVTPFPTVTANTNSNNPQLQSTSGGSGIDAYTLKIAVVDKNGKVGGANSVVVYSAQNGTIIASTTTDETGQTQLTNIPPGTYNVVVAQGTEKLGEQVITVGGTNPLMAFTIRGNQQAENSATEMNNASHTTRNLILSMILIVLILLAGAAIFLFVKKRRKGKNHTPPVIQTQLPPTQ